MGKDRRLGRGLESLLGSSLAQNGAAIEKRADDDVGVMSVPIAAIRANPSQPRQGFDAREMDNLVESVKSLGVLQPVVVRRSGEGYDLIAGERRLRASQLAGLDSIPAVEREASDDEMLTLALVENLQREDLNPIEKARGFRTLIEQHGLTQEQAGKRIGKDRSTIANFIRLLDLPEAVQHVVSRGTLSMGHARALLGLDRPSAQQALALRIEEEGLSVREVEQLVAKGKLKQTSKRSAGTRTRDPYLRDLEDRARERCGCKVTIAARDGRGRVVIHFSSEDDFNRVLGVLGIAAD